MGDTLIRGIFPETGMRFAYCQAAELCNEGMGRHQADLVSGWLLSEALVCATLLSVNLKSDEKLTLRWIYPGPIGTIMADLNEHGEVRGFPQRLTLVPQVQTQSAAIGGPGRISGVNSFPNRVGRTGITEAVFQDVPRDLAYFLSLSFQVESALAVGLNLPPREPATLRWATGLLLQALPGADLEAFDVIRRRVELPAFRNWLEAETPDMANTMAWLEIDEAPQTHQEIVPAYRCYCSKEKVESVLRMLDPNEIQEMLEQDGMAKVDCHFCAHSYVFTRGDLISILDNIPVGRA